MALISRGLISPTSQEIFPNNMRMVFSFLYTVDTMELHLNYHPHLPFLCGLPVRNLNLSMADCPTPNFDVAMFADVFSSVRLLDLTLHRDTVGPAMECLDDNGPWRILSLKIEPRAIPLTS
ncbi:hypothetical protein BGZ46_004865, partial [Entomortierella lignicola]